MTECCCPANVLVIQNHNNVLHGALQIGGDDCKGSLGLTNFTVTNGSNPNTIALLGTFTPRGADALEVLLEQNTLPNNLCKVTMNRIQSSTNNNSSGGGGNQSTIRTTTTITTTAKNHVSSNYNSIFIKVISIIMITTVIIHI
ncbi:unnamed protein product [Rotaria sordida]|uniref:Uncharacterized protein n=1 Tax=Rotaria sordida TaxID=392033 RepID=A0A814PDA8_9BILA|nr:unnamed protein product [Rotaria sordida]CAF0942722.1 unnamed protein product [Rotaria sordida]CAF0996962.1 unnamed protein product [Rotaria sordida]CAF1083942.1 unnamed protein product [Rotaria sordida]CAF1103718.1 unnamed protein product [Rotaria sordida]